MRRLLTLLAAVAVDVVVILVVPEDYPSNVAGGAMFLGVMGATFVGGRLVGLLASLAAVVAFAAFTLTPVGEVPDTVATVTASIIYAVVLIAAVLLITALEASIHRLRATQRELNDSLATTQRALLPGPVPGIEDVALGRYYRPAGRGHAGGDWYTIVPLDENRIGLGIGDAAGHGLAALSVMARTRFGMLAYALLDLSPAAVLERINHMLCTTATNPGRFVTATFGVLDRAAMTWTEARAGHPPTVRRRADGEVEILNSDHHGLVLGIELNARYEDVTVELGDGDLIALYTDGLVERPAQSVDVGIAALAEGLAIDPGDDLDELCSILADRLGTERDDIALLLACVEAAVDVPVVYRRSLPAAAAEVSGLRRELNAWLEDQAILEHDRWAVVLAASELATNAIEHGCGCDGVSAVDVTARLRDDAIEITVHDPGVWTAVAGRTDRGRGLGMVSSVMDRVSIETGSRGTTVRVELTRANDSPGPAQVV